MWFYGSAIAILLFILVMLFGAIWPVFWFKNTQSTSHTAWYEPWWHFWCYACKPLLSWRHRQRLQQICLDQEASYLERIFAQQCLASVGVGLFSALCSFMWGWATAAWFLVLLGGGLGFLYPQWRLMQQRRQQFDELRRELPFMLDLLTLCLEAGIGFFSAFQLCVQQLPPHVLARQLRYVLDDIRTGQSQEQALTSFSQRLALMEADAFVAAVLQSLELGGSLAPLLRQQAVQRRQERFLRAEKKALEAPVKMLLPLVCCIFPCTFLVIGYPLFYQLMQSL